MTALRSAAPWHEVLVIDDGSTDGTGKAAQDAGARVVRHPYNKGNGAAVKTGIRSATSDWIAIVDADGQHRADDTGAGGRSANSISDWRARSAHAGHRRAAAR